MIFFETGIYLKRSSNIEKKNKRKIKGGKGNLERFYHPLVAEFEMDKNRKRLKVCTWISSATEKKFVKSLDFISY